MEFQHTQPGTLTNELCASCPSMATCHPPRPSSAPYRMRPAWLPHQMEAVKRLLDRKRQIPSVFGELTP